MDSGSLVFKKDGSKQENGNRFINTFDCYIYYVVSAW